MMPGPKPGTIWRGRLLSRTIVDSKKLATVGERAALVYVLLLPQHDGEGMIEADDLSMLTGCGRFALARNWSLLDMATVREELVGAGLWSMTDGPHGEAAEFVGWEDHQRLDKIGRGSRLSGRTSPAISGTTPAISGTTQAQLRPRREVEVEVEVEDEDEAEAVTRTSSSSSPRPSTKEDTPLPGSSETANALIRCFRRAFRERNAEHPEDPIAPPGIATYEAEQIAREHGDSIAFFPTDELLTAEIRRVCRCALEKGWVLRFALCKQIGQAFPGTSQPDPVIWKQEPNGSGPTHPKVAALTSGIGRRMP
jgi:hypothetical protein